MRKTWIYIAVAIAMGVGAYLADPQRATQPPVLAVGLPLVVIAGIFALRSARVREMLVQHATLVRIAAVIVGAVGLAAPFVGYKSPWIGDDAAMGLSVLVFCVALMLFLLPRSITRYNQAVALMPVKAQALKTPPSGDFHGLRDALGASGFVLKHPGAMLRTLGPWLALAGASFWKAGDLTAARITVDNALPAIGWLLLFIVGFLLACATIAVAWHRLITGPAGKIGWLPGRAALGWLWRVLVFLMLAGAADRAVEQAAPAIARTLGVATPATVADVLGYGMILLALFLSTSFILVLPQIAGQEGKGDRLAAALAAQRLGWRFRLGVILAPAPLFIAGLLAQSAIGAWVSPALAPFKFLLDLIPTACDFGAVAALAVYLSRAWMAARSDQAPVFTRR